MRNLSRFHRVLIALSTGWTLLASATPPPLAASQCLDELEGSLARIIDVEADLDDLKLTVAWDPTTDLPATATLDLLDRAGGLVASATVTPVPGETTTELVPGALSQLAMHGLAYQVESPGVLTSPFHFQVGFTCLPGPASCELELTGDLETNAVVIDPELAVVLDTLALSGSFDTLGDVLLHHPELVGEVATLAWQLDELDAAVGLPTASCLDLWSVTTQRTPDTLQFDSDVEQTPWPGVVIENASCAFGASQYALAQKLDGAVAYLPMGETELGMSLRSWTVTGWGTLEIGGDAFGGNLDVRFPTLETCRAGCAAEVEHGLCFEADLAAAAKERYPTAPSQQIAADAAAYQLTEYWIGDERTVNSVADVTGVPGSGQATATDSLSETRHTQRPAPSTARLVTESHALVTAQGDNTLATCAIAEVTNEHQLDAIGYAGCAVLPTTIAITRSPPARGFFNVGGFNKTGGVLKRTWCP